MSGAALAVVVAREQDSARGADLAMRLGLPLLGVAAVSQWQEGDYAALLLLDGEHLALQALSPLPQTVAARAVHCPGRCLRSLAVAPCATGDAAGRTSCWAGR